MAATISTRKAGGWIGLGLLLLVPSLVRAQTITILKCPQAVAGGQTVKVTWTIEGVGTCRITHNHLHWGTGPSQMGEQNSTPHSLRRDPYAATFLAPRKAAEYVLYARVHAIVCGKHIYSEPIQISVSGTGDGGPGPGLIKPPTFDPPGGAFESDSVIVRLFCDTSGVTIRYTTDGSDPNESSPMYTQPFSVNISAKPVTVKARAFKSGGQSRVSSATYAYNPRDIYESDDSYLFAKWFPCDAVPLDHILSIMPENRYQPRTIYPSRDTDCIQFKLDRNAHVVAVIALAPQLDPKLVSTLKMKLLVLRSILAKGRWMDDLRQVNPQNYIVDSTEEGIMWLRTTTPLQRCGRVSSDLEIKRYILEITSENSTIPGYTLSIGRLLNNDLYETYETRPGHPYLSIGKGKDRILIRSLPSGDTDWAFFQLAGPNNTIKITCIPFNGTIKIHLYGPNNSVNLVANWTSSNPTYTLPNIQNTAPAGKYDIYYLKLTEGNSPYILKVDVTPQ